MDREIYFDSNAEEDCKWDADSGRFAGSVHMFVCGDVDIRVLAEMLDDDYDVGSVDEGAETLVAR